MVKMILCR